MSNSIQLAEEMLLPDAATRILQTYDQLRHLGEARTDQGSTSRVLEFAPNDYSEENGSVIVGMTATMDRLAPGSNGWKYAAEIAARAAGAKVLFYEAPGYGESVLSEHDRDQFPALNAQTGRPLSSLSFAIAQDVLRRTDGNSVTLAGSSLGANFALETALSLEEAAPGTVNAVFLQEPAGVFNANKICGFEFGTRGMLVGALIRNRLDTLEGKLMQRFRPELAVTTALSSQLDPTKVAGSVDTRKELDTLFHGYPHVAGVANAPAQIEHLLDIEDPPLVVLMRGSRSRISRQSTGMLSDRDQFPPDSEKFRYMDLEGLPHETFVSPDIFATGAALTHLAGQNRQ